MLCSRCGKNEPPNSLRLNLSKYKIEGEIINRLNCATCNSFIAIKITADTNKFSKNFAIDAIIYIEKEIPGIIIEGNNNNSGWKKVETRIEKIVYYILCQIIYPERDSPDALKHESIYDFADESDLIMLRWERGVPLGFYTVKQKGSKILSTNEEYAMPTLDTAYVRSEYRNRGIGLEILGKIIETFKDQDVGFSRPISDGMWKVLEKFLIVSKTHRLKFWEIEDGGNEGNRKLIWFTILKRRKKQPNGIEHSNNSNNGNNNNDE